jgi:hypothetical protein
VSATQSSSAKTRARFAPSTTKPAGSRTAAVTSSSQLSRGLERGGDSFRRLARIGRRRDGAANHQV